MISPSQELTAYTSAATNQVASREVELGRDGLALIGVRGQPRPTPAVLSSSSQWTECARRSACRRPPPHSSLQFQDPEAANRRANRRPRAPNTTGTPRGCREANL